MPPRERPVARLRAPLLRPQREPNSVFRTLPVDRAMGSRSGHSRARPARDPGIRASAAGVAFPARTVRGEDRHRVSVNVARIAAAAHPGSSNGSAPDVEIPLRQQGAAGSNDALSGRLPTAHTGAPASPARFSPAPIERACDPIAPASRRRPEVHARKKSSAPVPPCTRRPPRDTEVDGSLPGTRSRAAGCRGICRDGTAGLQGIGGGAWMGRAGLAGSRSRQTGPATDIGPGSLLGSHVRSG